MHDCESGLKEAVIHGIGVGLENYICGTAVQVGHISGGSNAGPNTKACVTNKASCMHKQALSQHAIHLQPLPGKMMQQYQ